MNSSYSFTAIVLKVFRYIDYRVLPINQIHGDEWPIELEKGGPFHKIWGPSELPIYL